VKKNNKSRVWFTIFLTALYMAYVFPTAVVKVEAQDTKQTTNVESETGSVEPDLETTTIEEEPTAEAASPQSQLAMVTQMSIIGLGIMMVGVGTYLFCFKKKTEE